MLRRPPYTLGRTVSAKPDTMVVEATRADIQVVLKLARTPTGADRIQREALLLQKISRAGVVECIDAAPDGAWLATRRLPGPCLLEWADARPLEERLEALARTAEVIASLHADGVVHGDLKSSNLLIGDDGRPHVCDLDLAASTQPTDGFFGTYGTASPEQLRGAPPEPASDVFALGILLCRLLSPSSPFPLAPTAQPLHTSMYLPKSPAYDGRVTPIQLDELVCEMLDRSAQRRPSARRVAERLRSVELGQTRRYPPVLGRHWHHIGRDWVAVADHGESRALVVYGAPAADRAAVYRALQTFDRREAPRERSLLMRISEPSTLNEDLHLLSQRTPTFVVIEHDRPLPRLQRLGVPHICVPEEEPAAAPDGSPTLMALLADGPRSAQSLAATLHVSVHDIIAMAEPLVEEGAISLEAAPCRLRLTDSGPT